jgi:hypothetical protein
MTVPTIDRAPISAYLLGVLRTGTADAVGAGGGSYEWGDNAVPPAAEQVNPTLPYGIHYDLPGVVSVLGADGVQADAALVVQETVVGATPEQVLTLGDRARSVLCQITAHTLGAVRIVRIESDGHPTVARVGSLFQAPESFTVYVSYGT